MKKAIYPGSFDPVTLGHIDVIERASKLFDQLIIAVLGNSAKTPLFSTEERVKMLKEVTKHIPNVEVESFGGLTVDFAKAHNANAMVRGLRAVTDFEYELQWATFNQMLDENFEAVFLMANTEHSFLSSSIVKEIGLLGGDIKKMVAPEIYNYVKNKLSNKG